MKLHRTFSLFSAVAGLLLSTAAPVQAKATAAAEAFKDYAVDSAHSNVEFKIKHLFSKVSGSFKEFEGTFQFDETSKKIKGVTFKIQAKSIDTSNAKRDEHLRAADFFDVAKYETITFTNTEFAEKKAPVSAKGKKKKDVSESPRYELKGDLTLHGQTKPVTFEVESLGTDKDPWGNVKSAFLATTTIQRKDFGISWNKTLDSGNLLLGNDVEISLQIEAAPVVAKADATEPTKK